MSYWHRRTFSFEVILSSYVGGTSLMGKTVPDWQTFIRCDGGHLIIRHLKSGLAENLEIPWPEKLKGITCEKVRFRVEDLRPLSQCGKTLDFVDLKDCEF